MWISFTSLPNESLVGSLTTEIYYRTGIAGKTHLQTDRHIHTHREREREKERGGGGER